MAVRRLVLLAALLVLAGCGGGDGGATGTAPSAPKRLQVTSPDVPANGRLPRAATCDGTGRAPELRVAGVPRRATGLAVLVQDPDAPGGTFVHWTGWGFPAGVARIAPPAPHEGANSSGDRGYTPPCPPGGDPAHRYRFTIYALARPLGVRDGAPADAVEDAIARAGPLAAGTLVARYARR